MERLHNCSLATNCLGWARRYPLRVVRNNDCWTDGVVYSDSLQIGLLCEGPISDLCTKRVWGEASSCACLVYATSNQLQGFCDLQYARIEWTRHTFVPVARCCFAVTNSAQSDTFLSETLHIKNSIEYQECLCLMNLLLVFSWKWTGGTRNDRTCLVRFYNPRGINPCTVFGCFMYYTVWMQSMAVVSPPLTRRPLIAIFPEL